MVKHTEEWEPCPFCGGEGEMKKEEVPMANGPPVCDFRFEQVRFIGCNRCGIGMKSGFQHMDGAVAEENAIAAWNKRTSAPRLKAERDELLEACRTVMVLVEEGSHAELPQDAIDAIRAAITKAEGSE